MGRQIMSFNTQSYIEPKKLARDIELAAKKIQEISFSINQKSKDYYKLQIWKQEKHFPKEYGEYIHAIIEFMLPTLERYNNYQEFTLYMGKKYITNGILSMRNCNYLLGEFLEVFMPMHPDFIYVGENEDNAGNPAMYTPAHLRAGKALNEPEWPWINPDKLLEDYYKLS